MRYFILFNRTRLAFKNTIPWLFLCSIKKKKNQSFSIMHSGIYPIWCKHIMNPFTFLINRVILSTLMFSAVYIQFYHILQIRTKRTYFRLLLQLNICKKEGGKYLKVQWVYWDNSRGHEYAVFLAKPGNTDQQKKTLNSVLHKNFELSTHGNLHLPFSFFF